MQTTDRQKLLSALCHGSIFFSATIVSIGIPIVILLITDDWVIKDNAREALNFHINLFAYGILASLFFATVIGIPIALIIGGGLLICSWLLPILAIVKVLDNPGQPYRYPFILRLL
ncbi:DUF4870 domain-containing protein [Leptolyngbya sp. FACHB-17]|uniref:DUF4870 domain-containing protein n=1 Tax=unclassified Leptolyngbya TaxID=2650499 RepID=UPI00168098F1|nr:DUF4870 domain-containing protein [Leptolyngbya sp. FACHB-17]MBD2082772.1 DUF4870 domain-containing protein [Leptolyngbya sp. FACHB-17]